jgi:hypothetical protein
MLCVILFCINPRADIVSSGIAIPDPSRGLWFLCLPAYQKPNRTFWRRGSKQDVSQSDKQLFLRYTSQEPVINIASLQIDVTLLSDTHLLIVASAWKTRSKRLGAILPTFPR